MSSPCLLHVARRRFRLPLRLRGGTATTTTTTATRCLSSTPACRDRYAFLGLGQMGFQMAKNLQANLGPRDSLALFDVNRDAMERLAADINKDALGGKGSQTGGGGASVVELASSAADAAESADVVITVLPEPSHVKSVYASILEAATATSVNSQEEEPAPAPAPPPPPPPRGPGPRPGPRLFIDCSTIDPSSSRQVAASVAKAFQLPGEESQEGAAAAVFVDAPMSGGTVGAAAGTLTFMLGAPAALVPRVEPVLLRMGRAVVHCGPPGAGLAAKLANNYLLAVANVATAEAMNLGVRWGLDPAVLARVLNASTGRCWPSEVNNPVPGVVAAAPASRDYAGGFGLALMNKDLRLAMVAADEAGARLPLAGAARALYEAAEQDERCKGRDFSVVYRYIGGKE